MALIALPTKLCMHVHAQLTDSCSHKVHCR